MFSNNHSDKVEAAATAPFGGHIDTNPNSSIASGESSLTAQGLITYNKTIHVKPEELTFSQVQANQQYVQTLTMLNTLSAPVEIILKSSNQERLDLAPKQLKLAPHEQFQVTVTFRQPRPFPAKASRQKETIFIKSDFFDQKVAVYVIPAIPGDASSTGTSLQRAAPTQGRGANFPNMTSTMSRQQLATTTIGKTSGGMTRPSPTALTHNDMGTNDSFGRATTTDAGYNRQQEPSPQVNQERKRQQEFSPAIQQSEHVEVTLAADSKADIVSGAHYLGSEFDRDQEIASAKKRQFESHEVGMMRQQLNEVRSQNEELKSQLAAAQAKAYSSETSTSSVDQGNLDQIKLLLREHEPKLEELLTEAMKHERANAKRKDTKILEILQFKDQQLTEMSQAMTDYQVLKSAFAESQDKLAQVTQQLEEAMPHQSSDDRFEELLKSQTKVNEQQDSIGSLENQLKSMQSQLEQGRSAKTFLEEACERSKNQAVLIQGKLDATLDDLEEESKKNSRLEEHAEILRSKLEKMTEQAFSSKVTDESNDKEGMRLQLERTELEKARLQEKVFQMQDQMQQVFQTLGKVTGESPLTGQSSTANLQGSESKASTDGGNENRMAALENSGFNDQLAQRAEEIVLIVEQIQAQYTMLEKEMRSLVNKASCHPMAAQTELRMAEIDDMNQHFKALQAQVREQAQQSNISQDQSVQQLEEQRREIYRLNEVIQGLQSNQEAAARKESHQNWLQGGASNENLLTNRHSNFGGDDNHGHVEILVSEHGAQDNHQKGLAFSGFSVNTAIQNNNRGLHGNHSQSNLGSNRQVVEMQERENQLLDQLSILKEQMRFQTSHSEANTLGVDPGAFANEHHNLRVGELETLIFQQREQILTLQDQTSSLKKQLEDQIEENKHKLELYEVRNHNLKELNQKYQDAAGKGQNYENLYTYTSGITGLSPEYKSTQQETERMKHTAQTVEIKNMDLQHSLKETRISLQHTQKAKDDLAGKVLRLEQEMSRVHQDSLLQKAGVNIQDSRLAMLVTELKNRIKKLESEKLGISQLSGGHHTRRSEIVTKENKGELSGHTSLYALKEEYCTKLEKLTEQNSEERSEAQGQIMTLKQRVEGQANQLKVGEEKELRLFSQLEELKSQRQSEEELANARIKDLSSMLDSKQQVCSDIEREVKQKEKMLAERQEQLSILLSAMEQQNSLSQSSGLPEIQQNSPLEDAKQRLANMAAELCSLKAVEAQMERRCADMAHNETVALQKTRQLEQQLDDANIRSQVIDRKVQTFESSNNLLERQKQDLSNRVEEVEREKADNLYKQERLMFQLRTKEETIAWLKQQATQAEVHFKEQVDRIREDLITKQNVATLGRNRTFQDQSMEVDRECHGAEHRPRREISLKIAIQQLHLVISDYIERSSADQVPTSMEEAQKNIIFEMEKALGVAQTTIQRIEADLDRERSKCQSLENEWDSLALNGILLTRQERMTVQIKSTSKLLSEREQCSMQIHRQQLDALNRIVRSQDIKLDSQAKLESELDSELQELKQANKKLSGENEELETNVMCVQQEQASLKLAQEKRAQMQVDERQRERQDALQNYYDSTLSKILIGTPSGDKILEMGRQIASLQLLIDKQRRQIDMQQSEKDGLMNNLRFYKSQQEDQEVKLRDVQAKATRSQAKLDSLTSGAMRSVIVDKAKQDNLSLEKELIRQREALDLKQRELTSLQQRLQSHKFDDMQSQLGQDLQQLAQKKKDAVFGVGEEQANSKIQSLQEQLMEIRGCHIQELEELKVQCDVDVAEARRELSQQQRQFESKFMPGTAPGEILDQNHELRERVAKLQVDFDHLCQENDGQRGQLNEQCQQNELLQNELGDREMALQELEYMLVNQQQPNNPNQVHPYQDERSATVPLKPALKQKSGQTTLTASSTTTTVDGFVFTPPMIVRELFSAKRAEIAAKQKLRAQLQTEVKLRQQLTQQLQDDIQQQKQAFVDVQLTTSPVETSYFANEEVVNQLMAQNSNILSILQDGGSLALDTMAQASTTVEDDTQNSVAQNKQHGVTEADFDLLLRTVIHFANQLAMQKSGSEGQGQSQPSTSLLNQPSLKAVAEAQRIVIRALTQRHQADRIKYAPERDVDRKVWYLELLEEQVADLESQTTKLQDFVKRLQIGVSGSLHSAAEIKASSMDLAQHLKQASEEIKTLRNVTGLIKHDVLALQEHPSRGGGQADLFSGASVAASINNNEFNPFLTGRNDPNTELKSAHLQQTQRTNMDRILNEHESMHNQLSLTSKIKQSLETELVQSKLQHASEMQQVIQKMSVAEKRLHEFKQVKSQMQNGEKSKDEHIERQEQEIASLKTKLTDFEKSMQGSKLEVAKARESSKHWQKMQGDMQEWRRSNDETLRAKQKQLQEAQDKVTQLKAGKKRMKAEVGMLRQNQKEIREGATLESVRKENEGLVLKFNEQLDERRKEIEFWVQERAQMRDKIDQLESANVVAPIGLFDLAKSDPTDVQDQVEKLSRKLKVREIEAKQLKSDLVAAKNKVSKAELKQVKLDAQIREASTKLTEEGDKLHLAQNRAKELEIEKEMLLARQKQANVAMDQDQIQVSHELDKLREDFSRLRVQKEELEGETKLASEREKQWRDTIDRLNRDLVSLQNRMALKDSEGRESGSLHEKKSAALLSDLKFMRDENQKLHEKLKEANECVSLLDQQIAQVSQEQAQVQVSRDALKREISEKDGDRRTCDLKVAELQATLQQNETGYFNKFKSLQSALTEVKQEAMQSSQLLQAQLEVLKSRLVQEKRATSKEVEQSLALTQKETLLKHAKKELATGKAQIAKLKLKNKDLKAQLDKIPQKQAITVASKAAIPGRRAGARAVESTAGAPPQSAIERVIVERLSQTDGLKKLLAASQMVNELEVQVSEGHIELQKVENWNYALQQQLDEAKDTLEQAEEKIMDLMREKKEVTKAKNQSHSQNEKLLKEQIKSLGADLERIRAEWASPQTVAAQLENIQSLQTQVKQLQADVQRKAKHLGQVKQQKAEATEGQSQVQNDMATLQQENIKLKSQLREAQKAEKTARDLRGTVDWLTKSEKRLKEEMLTLNEKLKSVRAELARKDQHLKDYKDRIGMIQTEATGTAELQEEINRLKEQNRRQRLDMEVKENQVKSFRNRIEQNFAEIQTLSKERNDLLQQDTEAEVKLRTQKQKAKRQEVNLIKSVTALKRIGVELVSLQQHKNSVESARFGVNPDASSPRDRKPIQIYRGSSSAAQGTSTGGQAKQGGDFPLGMDDLAKEAAYYKDSVEILGLSMNEMEDFINPMASASKHPQAALQMAHHQSPSSLISSIGTPIGKTVANVTIVEKLERFERVNAPKDLVRLENEDIEELGNQCVRMLSSMMVQDRQ